MRSVFTDCIFANEIKRLECECGHGAVGRLQTVHVPGQYCLVRTKLLEQRRKRRLLFV